MLLKKFQDDMIKISRLLKYPKFHKIYLTIYNPKLHKIYLKKYDELRYENMLICNLLCLYNISNISSFKYS